MSQATLARLVGISAGRLSAIEAGEGGGAPAEVWFAIAQALGLYLRFEFGRDPQAELRDAGHLAMQELVLRIGRQAGWEGLAEALSRPYGSDRSIDVRLTSRAIDSSRSPSAGTRSVTSAQPCGRAPASCVTRRSRQQPLRAVASHSARAWSGSSATAGRTGSSSSATPRYSRRPARARLAAGSRHSSVARRCRSGPASYAAMAGRRDFSRAALRDGDLLDHLVPGRELECHLDARAADDVVPP